MFSNVGDVARQLRIFVVILKRNLHGERIAFFVKEQALVEGVAV